MVLFLRSIFFLLAFNISVLTSYAQVFNNHPNDCPTVGVVTKKTAISNCWPTSISDINIGDEVLVGIYFHNNSPIDTGIMVRLSDPRNGYGKSLTLNGIIKPESGAGAAGFATLNSKGVFALEYLYTRVYFNGVDTGFGGSITDATGRIFGEGEPIKLVPGLCQNCGDSFLWQGVVKVYFRVVKAGHIIERQINDKINFDVVMPVEKGRNSPKYGY